MWRGWESWDYSAWRRLRGDLIDVHLMGANEEEGARLSSAAPSGRTRGKGHKLQNMKLNLSTRKNFLTTTVVKHCKRLPAEIVASPPLESTQNLRGQVLGNLLWVTLLEQEGLDLMISKVPSNLNDSVKSRDRDLLWYHHEKFSYQTNQWERCVIILTCTHNTCNSMRL